MRDPNPIWPNERLRIAELEDELDRLRAEVNKCRDQCWQITELIHRRAEVEQLREALREVNENLPGSCTDEKSWLAECLRDVREIISDALTSTAPKTERKFTGPGYNETTGYTGTAPKTEDAEKK